MHDDYAVTVGKCTPQVVCSTHERREGERRVQVVGAELEGVTLAF